MIFLVGFAIQKMYMFNIFLGNPQCNHRLPSTRLLEQNSTHQGGLKAGSKQHHSQPTELTKRMPGDISGVIIFWG